MIGFRVLLRLRRHSSSKCCAAELPLSCRLTLVVLEMPRTPDSLPVGCARSIWIVLPSP